jgi:hypothetical protein
MKKLLVILLCLTYISGCSTVQTANTDRDVDYDLASVETYFVVADKELKNPMISDIDRNRFNNAIDNEFSMNGLIQDQQETADILVSYFVLTKDKIRVKSSGNSGYYGNVSRYGRAIGYSYGGANVNTKNYTEGTFIVDIIDNKTKMTVWRSTLIKPIKTYDNVEKREQAVAELISTMFAELNH